MANFAVILAVLLALGAATSAYAQCIECSACTSAFCFDKCKPSCKPGANAGKCMSQGAAEGFKQGGKACELTFKFCGQTTGSKPKPRGYGGGSFTVDQCQNMFYGNCVKNGKISMPKECLEAAKRGYKACNNELFVEFFTGELAATCKSAATSYKP